MAELLMRDPFARTAARKAHETAKQARDTVANLERLYAQALDHRPAMFAGLCTLCGGPCKPPGRYCTAHEWAA